MHAVVSLLDEQHWQLVEALWDELCRDCGVKGIYGTPFPHFSYQVAAGYDAERLEESLAAFARRKAPFRVRTTGLGLFTGSTPVLYVPVVRSPELTRFHRELWPRGARVGAGLLAYYEPDRWMPHITLGYGDLNRSNLAGVIQQLSERDFAWDLPVDNVALIYDNGAEQGVRFRFRLQGS